jgi:LPXTG-motif cell wall-anchored protein
MSTNTTSRTAVQASTESSDTQSGAADSSDAGANDTGAADTASNDTASNDSGIRLADTGSVNTTPYVVGGTLLLGLGAGFVTYSVRRERAAAF